MYVNHVLDVLAEEGKRLVVEAYKTKDFNDRTGTLSSNYCYVCLYDSIMYRFGDAYNEAGIDAGSGGGHKGLKGTGWHDGGDWSNALYEGLGRHFSSVAPAYKRTTQGFELLILNTAYYAQFLEDGSWAKGMSKMLGHHIEPKYYKVIAQIGGSCQSTGQRVASKIKGLNFRRVDRIGWEGIPLKPNFR